MVVSLSSFLNQAVQPISDVNAPQDSAKYRWVCSNQAISYQQYDPSMKKDSLIKIYSIMNKQLKAYEKNVSSIGEQERTELRQLKSLIQIHTRNFKTTKRGPFKKVYILFKNLFNPSVSQRSQNLIAHIDKITLKPITPDVENLDVFLNLVSPKAKPESIDVSFLGGVFDKKWVYYQDTGLIKDEEYDVNDESEEDLSRQLLEVLTHMDAQLDKINLPDQIDTIQQLQIETLKTLVMNRVNDAKDLKDLSPLKASILEKVETLLKIKTAEPPSQEEIARLDAAAFLVCKELYTTEKTFLFQVNRSIEHLNRLKELSTNKDVHLSPKLRRFFKEPTPATDGKHKAYFEECLHAFEVLQGHAAEFVSVLDESLAFEDVHERNRALLSLYEGALFKKYSKSASVCARYYEALVDLEKDLKRKNGISVITDYLNVSTGEGNGVISPTSDFIACIQRPMRHPLLLQELLKKTHSESLIVVRSCYIEALSSSVNVDKRIAYKFEI